MKAPSKIAAILLASAAATVTLGFAAPAQAAERSGTQATRHLAAQSGGGSHCHWYCWCDYTSVSSNRTSYVDVL